jgi:hypothetical protein
VVAFTVTATVYLLPLVNVADPEPIEETLETRISWTPPPLILHSKAVDGPPMMPRKAPDGCSVAQKEVEVTLVGIPLPSCKAFGAPE